MELESPDSVPSQRSTVSYPWRKTVPGGLWSPFKEHQQQSGTKKLRTTTQKGKEGSFILPAPSHSISSKHCSVPKGDTQPKRLPPHRERKSSMSDQLPQLFRAQQKFPYGFCTTQRLAKLKCVEAGKHKEEKERFPTSSSHVAEAIMVPIDLYRKTQPTQTHCRLYWFLLHRYLHSLMPAIEVPPNFYPLTLHLLVGTIVANSLSLCICARARHWPEFLWLIPIAICLLEVVPPAVHLHSAGLKLVTSLHYCVHTQKETCNHETAYKDSGSPAVCGPKSGPVFCYLPALRCNLQLAPPATYLHAPHMNLITGLYCCAPMARPSSNNSAHKQPMPLQLSVHLQLAMVLVVFPGTHHYMCVCNWPLPLTATGACC